MRRRLKDGDEDRRRPRDVLLSLEDVEDCESERPLVLPFRRSFILWQNRLDHP